MSYPKLTIRGWGQIPQKYIYYAVDADGKINAYRELPYPIDTGRFTCSNPDILRMGKTSPCPDWQNSLQQRPPAEQPTTAPALPVSNIRLSTAEFDRIAADFGLHVRNCGTCRDAAMYNPGGFISIVFVCDAPLNVTVHDSVNGIPVKIHDQIN